LGSGVKSKHVHVWRFTSINNRGSLKCRHQVQQKNC